MSVPMFAVRQQQQQSPAAGSAQGTQPGAQQGPTVVSNVNPSNLFATVSFSFFPSILYYMISVTINCNYKTFSLINFTKNLNLLVSNYWIENMKSISQINLHYCSNIALFR